MAEGRTQCSVCHSYQQSPVGMKSLRCGHAMCLACARHPLRNPVCTECRALMTSESRPVSFAEVNLELTLPQQHRECEEKAESCQFRGQAEKCQHCNLYLCPEHVQKHGKIVLDNAAEDVRKLQEIKRQAAQRTNSSEALAAHEEYRRFKELAASKLDAIAQAVQALDAAVRKPIITYESHLARHSSQRDNTLAELDKILGQLQGALRRESYEDVLNAQRTFQYMQGTGSYLLVQRECVPRFDCTLDAGALEIQSSVVESALHDLRNLARNIAAPSEPAAASNSSERLENRMSCLYTSLPSQATHVDGSKLPTFEHPLDIDCYSAPNEPLLLFVAEANESNTKVTLRVYTESQTNSREVPLGFIRNQQLITSFQPRRLAVMTNRKLIAMTDVRSNQYSRHIFVCDFTGENDHKVLRLEGAKTLNGIHARGNRIYVCDTSDCSVFIVEYNENAGRQKRVVCSGSVPLSVSTWNESWMLVACGSVITPFTLDTLQPLSGIQAVRRLDGSGSEAQVLQFRDIVHFSNGNFAVNTANSVIIYRADMTQVTSIGGAELTLPGLRFEDLMGMCATEQDGRIRIFVCDRSLKQISILAFGST